MLNSEFTLHSLANSVLGEIALCCYYSHRKPIGRKSLLSPGYSEERSQETMNSRIRSVLLCGYQRVPTSVDLVCLKSANSLSLGCLPDPDSPCLEHPFED